MKYYIMDQAWKDEEDYTEITLEGLNKIIEKCVDRSYAYHNYVVELDSITETGMYYTIGIWEC